MKSIFVCFAFLLAVLKVDRKNSSHTKPYWYCGCEKGNTHNALAQLTEIKMQAFWVKMCQKKYAPSASFSTRKILAPSISADANLKQLNFAVHCAEFQFQANGRSEQLWIFKWKVITAFRSQKVQEPVFFNIGRTFQSLATGSLTLLLADFCWEKVLWQNGYNFPVPNQQCCGAYATHWLEQLP